MPIKTRNSKFALHKINMCGSFACDKIAQRNWFGLLSFPRYLGDMIQKIKWLCIDYCNSNFKTWMLRFYWKIDFSSNIYQVKHYICMLSWTFFIYVYASTCEYLKTRFSRHAVLFKVVHHFKLLNMSVPVLKCKISPEM